MPDFSDILGTSSGNAEIDRIMEFAAAVCMMPDPAGESKPLSDARAKAAQTTLQRAAFYRSHGIRNDLVHMVVEKRLKLIAEATAVQELKEIEAEPKPRYTGNGFVSGKFSVPEEEMIIWSLTSLKAPLVSAGFDRDMALFQQVFGTTPQSACGVEWRDEQCLP